MSGLMRDRKLLGFVGGAPSGVAVAVENTPQQPVFALDEQKGWVVYARLGSAWVYSGFVQMFNFISSHSKAVIRIVGTRITRVE